MAKVLWEGDSKTGWVFSASDIIPLEVQNMRVEYVRAHKDAFIQTLYRDVWKELAELLAKGQPCVIQYSELHIEEGVLGDEYRLEVRVWPVERQKREEEGGE